MKIAISDFALVVNRSAYGSLAREWGWRNPDDGLNYTQAWSDGFITCFDMQADDFNDVRLKLE